MEETGTVYPLIIIDSISRRVIDVSLLNRKGYIKSLENGELWHLHKTTGKLLPYQQETDAPAPRPISLEYKNSWYEAHLSAKSPKDTNLDSENQEARGFRRPQSQAHTHPQAQSQAWNHPRPQTEHQTEHSGGPQSGLNPLLTVLDELEQTIYRRKQELPEGSYTTHLFTAGEEKIRKKTGEEAIELLLAKTREETTHEAADLLYHLLVLLCAMDIPFNEILLELGQRFST